MIDFTRYARTAFAGLVAALVLAVGSVAPGLARAETKHALFVAVNNYPELGVDAALSGPANDAALMIDYLTATPELGFARENIAVLANGGIENDGNPTRQAILDRMAGLADTVAPGDFVYLHFAGHGSRQRARNPAAEPDGLDEVFLPADTEDARDGIYPNALVDDDIGVALDAIRAQGAFVFIVFDSCHSSTATRNAGAGPASVKYRRLPEPAEIAPAAHELIDQMREPTLALGEARASDSANMGGLVAFFAAQTIEPTPELVMPPRSDGTKIYGLFSYTMLNVLAKNPGATYRELAQGIIHAYAADNFNKPTPLFEGDLDRIVLGGGKRRSVQSWPVEAVDGRASLGAGALHGVEKGAILALLPDPLAETDKALGYVRVRTGEPLSAQATPARYGGLPAPVIGELPPNIYARVVETPLSFALRVELPPAAGTRYSEAVSYARHEIEAVAGNERLPLNLQLVGSGEGADLKLIVASEAELYPQTAGPDTPRLWFLPPDGQIAADPRFKPHSIGLDGGMTAEQGKQLRENFVAVFRATSLAQLSGVGFGSGLSSSFRGADRAPSVDLSGNTHAGVGFDIELKRHGSGEKTLVGRSEVPLMTPGDELIFGINNQSRSAVDIDMLLIGPDYSITHMLGMRFQRGYKIEGALGDIADSGLGLWRLVLVMREARRNSDYRDLSFLNQIGAQTRASATGGARDFGQLLSDIGNAAPTRGAARGSTGNALKGSLEIFNLEAVPGG